MSSKKKLQICILGIIIISVIIFSVFFINRFLFFIHGLKGSSYIHDVIKTSVWECQTDDFIFTVYNQDNLPEEYKEKWELAQKTVSEFDNQFSESDINYLGVLNFNDNKYFYVMFSGVSNVVRAELYMINIEDIKETDTYNIYTILLGVNLVRKNKLMFKFLDVNDNIFNNFDIAEIELYKIQ